MISGKAKVCGIIANPVEHSLSPLMQNFYGEMTGVDFAYVPLKVADGDMETAVKGAYALNVTGMNVTVPYKQQVMPYLKEIDEDAKAIGAVNTLVRMDGGYKGYNTDAAGLLRAMKEEKITIEGQDCILIGAGGAAKAAAYVLAGEGARVVYLLNRSRERAEELAEEINERFGRPVMNAMALTDYQKLPEGSYLAVQSTSVGMHPKVDAAPIEEEAFYRMIHTGVDIIYTPIKTKFMSYVEAAGGRTMNGLSMLVYQGIEAFELWNPGVKVSEEAIAQAKDLMMRQLKGNIILIGFMGAGKTSVGTYLAKRCGKRLIDTDQMIEEKAGMSISEIFRIRGEAAFRQLETQALRELLEQVQDAVISVGGGLVLREENRLLLKRLGTVIYLKVKPQTVLERLKGDTTRPLLQGEDVEKKVDAMLSAREPVYEQAAHRVVETDGKEMNRIADEILKG